MNEFSDEILAAASRQGDRSAYALLVRRHYRYVFALCLGMLGNAHDAEDAAQETMLRGLVRIRNLYSDQRFGPWILRIARNVCIDLGRRTKRARVFLAQQTQESAETKENQSLQDAIRRLPKELRVPLIMYYFDNKSTRTIAGKLGISHSGLCQRIRAARRQLHELLSKKGVQDEQ